MAHSIESRTPLCDNELIDFALTLPLDTKLAGGTLKTVPKSAMRPRLPEVLFRLPKRGFPTPFALWYRREPLRSLMADLLLSSRTRSRGIFNTAGISAVWEANLKSGSDTLYDYARANLLYSLSMVELWFRTFIDSPRSRPS